ncbi:protein translocase subunit yajC [Desulfobulbus propionicus DSM 2032]|jgi:preprotein translocase, YajC subunit|uniref:Sec translocon accessory complex subunit YajC n=1 Tax=Desulfobulbus propionicus (strain ATCC 33891 / DSM 2032 / VKM B-1956 / 1pr3) TaxID=577650 RepID=A0A7U4DMI6_DESPD|nr:preprotein translocase subunit YajC [Desulfobulbus propionicus]ADW16216.1 protein translocase subunit yajC [Desulfobulbus propionicus DSM 2032]
MTGVAWAADAAAAPTGLASVAQFVPLILIFIVFYFLLIRPQQKKAKEHQNYLANLKKGDKVITGGGIHGQIVGLTDTVATLEIAENVRIKVNRAAIAGSAADADKPAPAKAGG